METSPDERRRGWAKRWAAWREAGLGWVIAGALLVFVARFMPWRPLQTFFDSFDWLTERALTVTQDLFASYGYLVVFFGPLLENTLFIGAIIPGTIVMLLAGLSAHDGLISFWPAVLLGAVGAMIGDTISYGIGRWGWRLLGPETRLVRLADRMREPLLERGAFLVLTYHFAGYSRLVGPAAAGFLRMPFWRWVLLDYLGVTLWVLVFLSGGFLLGVAGLSLEPGESERTVRVFEVILFALFAVAVFTVIRRAPVKRLPHIERPHIAVGSRPRIEPAEPPGPDGG
jgi:membrane protein DedA with SNARE-associated domain